MFTKSETETKLDAEIKTALDQLKDLPDASGEDYGTIVDRVSKLHKLKTEERSKPLSPDTLLVVTASLFQILWITAVERDVAITSKALSFMLRPK